MAINVTLGLITHPRERRAGAVCERSHLLRQEGPWERRKEAGRPLSLSPCPPPPPPQRKGTGPVQKLREERQKLLS